MTKPNPDLASIYASIEKLNHRLDKLESAALLNSKPLPHHSSLDKFNIVEAIADEIYAGGPTEKACSFEPNGRPCDHCSMCNTRGF